MSIDLSAMMARKEKVVAELTENVKKLLEKNRIQIIHGSAALAGPDRVEVSSGGGKGKPETLEAKAILLATGSEPTTVPGLEFDGKRIVIAMEFGAGSEDIARTVHAGIPPLPKRSRKRPWRPVHALFMPLNVFTSQKATRRSLANPVASHGNTLTVPVQAIGRPAGPCPNRPG